MFLKFNLTITEGRFDEYLVAGEEYYEKQKQIFNRTLESFIDVEGITDGTQLQETWFSTEDYKC